MDECASHVTLFSTQALSLKLAAVRDARCARYDCILLKYLGPGKRCFSLSVKDMNSTELIVYGKKKERKYKIMS